MKRAYGLIALAIALAGCSGTPATMTVHGTVEVAVQSLDEARQDYLSVYRGDAQVTITDPSGKVIATAPADGDTAQAPTSPGDVTITWAWTAKVPAGLRFYGVSVSGVPGTQQFTEAQMKSGPAVCAGDAC